AEVEAGRKLVGDALVLDETVLPRRMDRLLVEAHRVEIAAFESRDLGAHQRRPRLERLRAVFCPSLELFGMGGERLEMRLSLFGLRSLAGRRPGKRAVEVIL